MFFTDGIATAQNPEGASFGERRLQKLLGSDDVGTPVMLRDRIAAEVNRFRDTRPRGDDEALIVVQLASS